MATIIKKEEHDWQPHPNRIDGFRMFTDMARAKAGVEPKWLNLDLRKLPPGEYNAAYHFHRYAEELFFMLSGEATLRTPTGLAIVQEGDAIFFEAGERGAHQLYNHSDARCTYVDLRSFNGHDVCEYPDSDKLILIPNGETFRRSDQSAYFDGETNIAEIWHGLKAQEVKEDKIK